MFAAVLAPPTPAISLKPRRVTTVNHNNNQRKSLCLKSGSPSPSLPPLRLAAVGLRRRDPYGFSELRPLSSAMASAVACYASAGVQVLERPKVEIAQKTLTERACPEIDDGGGTTDDGGSGIGTGGGDDDDDGGWKSGPFGDDDDFQFDDDGDEDLGFFRRRQRPVPEVFDKRTTSAVLSEWMTTAKGLPLGLKEAAEMGILSSAELTKFLMFNRRPKTIITRLLARVLPQSLVTDFNAKIMADPALPHKLLYEAIFSVACSVLVANHRMKKEWPLVLTNALTNVVCNSFVVWSLAPSNSIINWPKLPGHTNSIFERDHRIRKFNIPKRALSFFDNGNAFFAIGFAAKVAAQIIRLEKKTTSTAEFARMSREALGAGASMALLTNIRYQLIWGIDRSLDLYFDVTKASLAFCLALRCPNVSIGTQYLNWVWSEDQVIKASSVVPWFFLKNVIGNLFDMVDTAEKKKEMRKRNIYRSC